MLGGIGYGVIHGLTNPLQTQEPLERALFEPYFKALSEGRIDEARERYTTPRYKQLFSAERYRQHWEHTFSRAGHIAKRNLFVANAAYELASGRHYTSVKYQLTFDRDYVQAVYEVVPDSQGNQRIDWAGQHQPSSSYTSPEPW